jgi:hypothetical protein
MERARQGVLVQLERSELEAKLRRAARASRALKTPTRLLEARYRASLVDTSLIGAGHLSLFNPSEGPEKLPLPSFSLALRQARLDTREAVLGDLDGTGLGLYVEEPGRHTLTLDWSARGEQGPNGLRFELKIPACVLTSFELDLPDDRVLALADNNNCLLSGPFPAPAIRRLLWRIESRGATQLDLLVRSANRPGALVFARSLQTSQTLGPDRLEASFDFLLEVVRPPLAEIVCECDPLLEPIEVRLQSEELATWSFLPANGEQPGRLLIRIMEPLERNSLSLRIRAVAPPALSKDWTSPGIRLAGFATQKETLVLNVVPGYQLTQWNPGSFELRTVTENQSGQTLTLQSSIAGSDKNAPPEAVSGHVPWVRQRPSARLTGLNPEFRVHNLSWWQISPSHQTLTAQLSIEPVRGQLHQFSLTLPRNWRVDQVEMTPAGLLQNWDEIAAAEGATQLRIVLIRPLERPRSVLLTLQLLPSPPIRQRSGEGSEVAEVPYPFPLLQPPGTQEWDGVLAVTVDPAVEAIVQTSLLAERADQAPQDRTDIFSPLSPFPATSPWGQRKPDHLYRVHGPGASGSLRLRSRKPSLRSRSLCEVRPAADSAQVRFLLALEPEIGNPDSVDLWLTSAVPKPWPWKTIEGANSVTGVQSLPILEIAALMQGLSANTPLAVTLVGLSPLRGSYWRLTLAQPLSGRLLLETQLEALPPREPIRVPGHLTALAAGSPWGFLVFWEAAFLTPPASAPRREIPLPVVLGPKLDGEVRVHIAGAPPLRIEAIGLKEVGVDSHTVNHRRVFEYEQHPLGLGLQVLMPAVATPVAPSLDNVRLLTALEPDGRLRHQYSLLLRNWRQRTISLRLPAAAELLAVQVDQHWLALAPGTRTAADELAIEVRVPGVAPAHEFEIVYATRGAAGALWAQLEGPLPVLPVVPLSVRRTWRLPLGVTPLDDSGFTRLQGAFSSDWELPAGIAAGESLWAVRQELVQAFSLGLTLMVLLAACYLSPATRTWRLRCFWGWLVLTTLAFVWLPHSVRGLAGWPLLAALVGALFWYVRASLRSFASGRPVVPVGAKAGAMAILLAVCLPSPAAAPGPHLVLLLPPAANKPDQQIALVTPELLDELQKLSRRSPTGLQGAVPLSARYEGKVNSGVADILADFQVFSFTPELTKLHIPVGSVELRAATLDGAPAYPVVDTPQNGFSVQLKGRGPHQLQIHFTIATSGTPDEPEVRFAIPELAQSQLKLTLPAESSFLQAVSGRGAQTLTRTTAGVILEADLGRTNSLQTRWRVESSPAASPAVQVSELYFWEIQSSAEMLRASLQYGIARGALTTLQIAIPEHLGVRRVETAAVAAGSAPRLRDWQLTDADGKHLVRLDFQAPVTGGLLVYLDLVPRYPLGPSAILALPTPQGVEFGEGFLAYRVEGRRAQLGSEFRHVTGTDPHEFQDRWDESGREPIDVPDHAYSFNRSAASTPSLRLQLHRPVAVTHALQDIHWHVTAQQVNLHATLTVDARPSKLSLLEWQVPPELAIVAVSGANVHSWSRDGTQLQAWLRRSTEEATVELTGWVRRSSEPSATFALPVLGMEVETPFFTYLRVTADESLKLQAEALKSLEAFPVIRPSDRELAYFATARDYGGAIRLLPATDSQVPAAVEKTPQPRAPVQISQDDLPPLPGEASESRDLQSQGRPAVTPPLLAAPPAEKLGRYGWSGLLFALCLAGAALSFYPAVFAWLRALIPEEIAVVSLAGWFWLDSGWPAAVLIALAAVARLVQLGFWLIARLIRPSENVPSPGNSINPAST